MNQLCTNYVPIMYQLYNNVPWIHLSQVYTLHLALKVAGTDVHSSKALHSKSHYMTRLSLFNMFNYVVSTPQLGAREPAVRILSATVLMILC